MALLRISDYLIYDSVEATEITILIASMLVKRTSLLMS